MKPKCLVASLARIVPLLTLLLFCDAALAQQPGYKWEKLAPPDEEFTVLMPGKAELSNEKAPYGQLTLSSNYYIVSSNDGPVFMIASVSGMETLMGLVSQKESLKAAADGFRDSFLKEVREKGLKAEMTFHRDLELNGHLGQEFDIVMGEMTGLARLYSTKKRLYALMVLNTLKDDKRVTQFLDSFSFKEAAAAGADSTKPAGWIVGPTVSIPPNKTGTASPPPAVAAGSRQSPNTPIRGGVLNGKAISLPKPVYPEPAQAAKASGIVIVEITIDENGGVMSARAVEGHPLLQAAAVQAAYKAKFTPTVLSGMRVKVSGVVTYTFVLD